MPLHVYLVRWSGNLFWSLIPLVGVIVICASKRRVPILMEFPKLMGSNINLRGLVVGVSRCWDVGGFYCDGEISK